MVTLGVSCQVILKSPFVSRLKGPVCWFHMPQLFHKLFSLDHFGVAGYGYSIIRFRRPSGS